MANDELRLTGFRPFIQPHGSVRVNTYTANTSQAIFLYQPVALNNSGQVAVAAIGDNVQLLGVCVGFLDANQASIPSANSTTTAAPNLAASTDAQLLVADDPDQEFLVESDTGGAAFAFSSIGNSCGFTYHGSGTGNTTTGISLALLDSSDAAADSGGSFKIMGVPLLMNQDGTTNAAGSNFTKVLVKINHHQLGQGSFSVSV